MVRAEVKKKQKIAAPIKSLKGLEGLYTRELNKLGKQLIKAVRLELLPYLKASQKTYVVDGIADQLGTIFRRLNSQFTGTMVAGFAKVTAEQAVAKTAFSNKSRFDRTIAAATGINLGAVIEAEGLEDFMALSVNKNVSLIKSLPEEYLKQVETIVNNGVVSGARYSTIQKEIMGKVGSASSKLAGRIKTIARNEIQTINSQITLRRSDALGIKKGIYRTSQDERVRPCHAELNGDEFEIKKGAWSKKCQKFIQPGITDINCRCSYSPIIETAEEVVEKPVKKPVVVPKKLAQKKLQALPTGGKEDNISLPDLFPKFRNIETEHVPELTFTKINKYAFGETDIISLKKPNFTITQPEVIPSIVAKKISSFSGKPSKSIKGVVLNGEIHIVDGHHRLAAYKLLGLNKIPIKIETIVKK